MLKSEYDKIIRENFDLSDRYTRQYIATLEDAGQELGDPASLVTQSLPGLPEMVRQVQVLALAH